MGLEGYLIYVLPEYVSALASNPHLVALQQEGFIQFVLWDQQVPARPPPPALASLLSRTRHSTTRNNMWLLEVVAYTC